MSVIRSGKQRLGAYVLPGDSTWLAYTLPRYYDLLDDLVVVAPEDRLGWTGRPVPVDECLDIVRRLDRRHICRIRWGQWHDQHTPIRADTAQRQAGIDALSDRVDWVVQIDNDELLPHPDRLTNVLSIAASERVPAVEWPMRVLYRRGSRGRFFEVRTSTGAPNHEYPGPIAVAAGSHAVEARRCSGPFLRPFAPQAQGSLQLSRPPASDEIRIGCLEPSDAIVHNSWARDPASVHQKVRNWGHNQGLRTELYYWAIWYPAAWSWPLLRNFHPLERKLWPRLLPADDVTSLLRSLDSIA
jgi:hypothetical protein